MAQRGPTKGKSAAPPTRPRGGPARAFADIMPDIGRSAFRRFGFVQSSVVTRWPEIVGEVHARFSAPEAIRFPPGARADGILELVVEGAHAPFIAHVIPEIIERVNRFFGYAAVARVKIRQGHVDSSRLQRRDVTGALTTPPAPATFSAGAGAIELGDGLRGIGDPELREVLTSLAQSLSRPRKEQ